MSQTNVSNLFTSAVDTGALSAQAAAAINIPDLGAQIQAGLGITPDDVQASEVLLVALLIDDSGSIRMVKGNSEAVRTGHNLVLDSLGGSKQKSGILTHCRYLNGTVLYPYGPLDSALRMDTHNYNPDGGTPLYDQTALILGTVLVKTQEFEDAGTPVRSVTAIVTDGADMHSSRFRSAIAVNPIVRDMLRAEKHIICAMGIDDGGQTDFRKIFGEMGIEDRWILTPGNSPSEIRKAFMVVSQSAVRASQGATSFSQTAMGGFGKP